MSVWSAYQTRLGVGGTTLREHAYNRECDYLERKFVNSLSFHEVLVEGHPQGLLILNQKSDAALKKICALPGQPLPHGGFVDFAGSKWIITERDSNDEVYASGKMQRCNYLMKWIDESGHLIEKWCIVVDGTKYLIGEKEEPAMAIGDARIAVTFGRDKDTCALYRGRRFIVDDPASREVLAYQITKSNKLFNVYDNEGVFRFIMNEVQVTDDDNVELRIADYYNWKPYKKTDSTHVDPRIPLEKIVSDALKEAELEEDKYGLGLMPVSEPDKEDPMEPKPEEPDNPENGDEIEEKEWNGDWL